MSETELQKCTPPESATVLGQRSRPILDNVICFSKENMTHVTILHGEKLIITSRIDDFDTKRISVDGGGSTCIIILDAFESKDTIKKRPQASEFSPSSICWKHNSPIKAC